MSNNNKKLGLGIAAVVAAGAGLAYAANKSNKQKAKKIAAVCNAHKIYRKRALLS